MSADQTTPTAGCAATAGPVQGPAVGCVGAAALCSPKSQWSRLRSEAGVDLRLWENPHLVGLAGDTPSGVRIGPVYTPPEHRRRGYATALVAHASREVIEGGKRFCFLYAGMANPTSNAIYMRVGYELACRSVMVGLEER